MFWRITSPQKLPPLIRFENYAAKTGSGSAIPALISVKGSFPGFYRLMNAVCNLAARHPTGPARSSTDAAPADLG